MLCDQCQLLDVRDESRGWKDGDVCQGCGRVYVVSYMIVNEMGPAFKMMAKRRPFEARWREPTAVEAMRASLVL